MYLFFVSSGLALYLLATAAFVVHVMAARDSARSVAVTALAGAFLMETFGILARPGAFALRTPHDQMSALAWFIVAVFLFLQLRYRLAVVGAMVSPLAFLLTLSAYVAYSGTDGLPPNLENVWLPAHVAPAFLGYAIFVLASCVSLIYLLQERQLKAKRRMGVGRRLPSLETLDELNYRCVAWGFGLFTIGIVTGSLLSKVAWNTFWSWEPLQILSGVAWMIYAMLLQSRSVGWRGRRAATLTLIGFAVLVVSFLSLNFGFTHGGSIG
jgi:cytochrome c-type biogenesis protein CcsB